MSERRATWASIRADGERARRTVEAGAIERAFARQRWSMARTAEALEVDVETLRQHLRRHLPELYRRRQRMAERARDVSA